MARPRKGKAKVKITASGRKISYGQAGKAKGGGPRVKPGTSKGDAYCARSYGIKMGLPIGKNTRINKNAFQAHMQRNIRKATMRERMKEKIATRATTTIIKPTKKKDTSRYDSN
jgi:hypothetical protein